MSGLLSARFYRTAIVHRHPSYTSVFPTCFGLHFQLYKHRRTFCTSTCSPSQGLTRIMQFDSEHLSNV